MIVLDYRTNNPRWGLSGVVFSNKESYAKTIGFLCNIEHYVGNNSGKSLFSRTIEIHSEGNNIDGAWDEEFRIHYYGDFNLLLNNLSDLANCSTKGVWDITCRINSNLFIKSLICDYGFVDGYGSYIKDIIPPSNIYTIALNVIHNNFNGILYDKYFNDGWNL